MKAVFILCALVVAVSARPDDHYTTKFDSIDLKEIMTNDRLSEGYYKCIMELGPCTAEGKELRSNIKDAMNNNCAKCSPKQKDGAHYVIGYLIKNKPTQWKDLCDKYDPEGIYVKQYEEQLKTFA